MMLAASKRRLQEGSIMRVEEGCSLAMVGEKTGSEAAEEGRGAAAGEKVCTAGEEH